MIALHQAEYIDSATKQQWKALSAPQLAVRFGWSDQYHALQADSDQRRAPQRPGNLPAVEVDLAALDEDLDAPDDDATGPEVERGAR